MLWFALVVAAACAASYPTAPSPAVPIALQVHYGSAIGRVRPGSTYAFQAYSLDTDGAYELVTLRATWTSSDVTVVQPTSISPSTFLPVAPGAARITARYGGLEASAWMVVSDPLLQRFPLLSVSPAHPGGIGRSAQVIALLQQTAGSSRVNVTTMVAWSSADPAVATIASNGVIRAVGPGTTLITASLDELTDWYWVSIAPGS